MWRWRRGGRRNADLDGAEGEDTPLGCVLVFLSVSFRLDLVVLDPEIVHPVRFRFFFSFLLASFFFFFSSPLLLTPCASLFPSLSAQQVKVVPKTASRKPVTAVPSRGGRRPTAPASSSAPRAPRVLTISRSLLAGPPLFKAGVQKASPSGRRVSAPPPPSARPYGFGGPSAPRGPSTASLPRAPLGPPASAGAPSAPAGATPVPQARHNYTIAPRRNAHGILLPA